MNFKIHRGTKEIGGSCVEISTKNTRILVDFGMPLVDKSGGQFDFKKHQNSDISTLVAKSVLPNIEGLYNNESTLIDGIVISHAHQDHYGLLNYIHPEVPVYLSEPTEKLIEINNLFTPQDIEIGNPNYFIREDTFTIGDISITPYWADHSAFDAHSFLIEADGKSIFYSGDFRAHGRKLKSFHWLIKSFNKKVDYLLLEGTTIGRKDHLHKTETDIEEELTQAFTAKQVIQLIYTSGQNIDRLVSIYRACLRSGRVMAVDVYIASVLNELSAYAKIPYPSDGFKNLKVFYPYFTSSRLSKSGNDKVLYRFKKFKITKEEIDQNPMRYVMLIRPPMQKDLEKMKNIDGGNFIYSMWEGYLKQPNTKQFISYLTDRGFIQEYIHTSGHADVSTLKKLVAALNPGFIVPIHTFEPQEYHNIFTQPVYLVKDGEII